LCCRRFVSGILGRLFPTTWCWLDAWGSFTRTEHSTAADGEEADKGDGRQQNHADDHPQSCRIHRLILGEESRTACLSDREWTRLA
jgi:hypothetical protein